MSSSEVLGEDEGRPRVITDDDSLISCHVWSRDPTLYVDEVALEVSIILDKYINPKDLWYWINQLGITLKKLWRVCLHLKCIVINTFFITKCH